jgi:hypothetical protein
MTIGRSGSQTFNCNWRWNLPGCCFQACWVLPWGLVSAVLQQDRRRWGLARASLEYTCNASFYCCCSCCCGLRGGGLPYTRVARLLTSPSPASSALTLICVYPLRASMMAAAKPAGPPTMTTGDANLAARASLATADTSAAAAAAAVSGCTRLAWLLGECLGLGCNQAWETGLLLVVLLLSVGP